MLSQNRKLWPARWDAEYRNGRYSDEHVPFVDGSSPHCRQSGRKGCSCTVAGKAATLPLVDSGLLLYGYGPFREALRQLADRRPSLTARLFHSHFVDFD